MANQISPGVYSKIIDLSSYLTSTSGTIGFVPVITEKGRDNQMIKISSIEQYRKEFGDPNIRTFGKYYGQGPYVALQHLSVSSDLYVLRALPDDATYSHAYMAFANIPTGSISTSGETTTKVGLTTFSACKKDSTQTHKIPDMTNTQKLDSMFTSAMSGPIAGVLCPNVYTKTGYAANDSVLAYVRGYGRGDYYDKISFMLRADSNPAKFGIYSFEVYEDQDDAPVLLESYSVGFNPTGLDSEGESNYIETVVNKYSTNVQITVNEKALEIMNSLLHNFYDNDPTIAEVNPLDQEGNSFITGLGFPDTMIPYYQADESSAKAGKITYGEYGEEIPTYTKPEDTIPTGYTLGIKGKAIWCAYLSKAEAKKSVAQATKQYNEAVAMGIDEIIGGKTRDQAISEAVAAVEAAQLLSDAADTEFEEAKSMALMQLTDSSSVIGEQSYYLADGSLGSMVKIVNGKRSVQPTVANQTLCLAYEGLLKKPVVVRKVDESTGTVTYKVQYISDVYDLDWTYFTIVYDAGYKPDVKQAAKQLVESRMDCVLLSDCGDNNDCEDVEMYVGEVLGASDCRSWNSYYCARYEPYTRVYDEYTGSDVWVSPIYTMAKILPQSDALYDVWYAAAGFTRGTTSEIKELRWNANKGERDRLYLAEVNPIVQFPEGMTVWGQLTTQKKASALSDLNCVRTVLYIKRAVEQYCRSFIFEFNDSTTWEAIKNGINPILAQIQAARGLKSYSIDVGATDYEFKTKTCHVNLTLEPMRVIEKIQLNMYIQ